MKSKKMFCIMLSFLVCILVTVGCHAQDVVSNKDALQKEVKEKYNLIYMGDTKFNFEDLGIEEYIKKLNKNSIAYSIGGDNYCYGDEVNRLLAQYNKIFHKYGIKTVLQGCSIN